MGFLIFLNRNAHFPVILRSERDERSLFFLSVVFQQKRISAKAQRFFIPLRFIQNDNLATLGRDDGMGEKEKESPLKHRDSLLSEL